MQLPRCFLWIERIKTGEQLKIGEMKQARGVVGHAIGKAWQMPEFVEVAMAPLVNAGLAEKI